MKKRSLILLLLLPLSGCTVVSANRVFPKVAWYWSKDAQMQRNEDKVEQQIRNGELPK